MKGVTSKDWFRLTAPIGASLFVVTWSVAVSPYTAYGDNWALIPVFLSAAFVLGWHSYLVLYPGSRRRATLTMYGIAHIALFVYLFMLSLMWISKDSL